MTTSVGFAFDVDEVSQLSRFRDGVVLSVCVHKSVVASGKSFFFLLAFASQKVWGSLHMILCCCCAHTLTTGTVSRCGFRTLLHFMRGRGEGSLGIIKADC